MTETSLLPKAAAAAGLSYAQLCQTMVELALARSRQIQCRPSGPWVMAQRPSGDEPDMEADHVV
jgi:hypothetical protein